MRRHHLLVGSPGDIQHPIIWPLVISVRSLSRNATHKTKEKKRAQRGRRGTKDCGSKEPAKVLWGYPAAPKSPAIPETMATCFRTCLRAMRAMEARLNIDFSYALARRDKGSKTARMRNQGMEGQLPISGDDSATGSRSRCSRHVRRIYTETNKA